MLFVIHNFSEHFQVRLRISLLFQKHSERADGTWLEVQPHPVFSRDGNSFLLMAPVQEGAIDTFTHIKHVTVTQQRIAVISHGHYEVTEVLAWDSVNHLV